MRTSLISRQKSQSARLGMTLAGVLAASAITLVGTSTADAVDPVATNVTVASFNVLGSSHTTNSTRYATGVERMRGVVKLLTRHSVEVVGFQELQWDQRESFLARTAGRFDLYSPPRLRWSDGQPRTHRDGSPYLDTDNSIAWNSAEWQPVPDSETYLAIPYFDGHPRAMPIIKLQNLKTGMTAWFANFHTPATNRRHPSSDRYRAQSIRMIAELGTRLRGDGIPVIFTGDMNERAKVFCALTGDAPMRAARGGYNRDGVCNPMHPWYVDWIFGLRRQRFSNYVEDRGALDKRISDHPVIVSDGLMDPTKFPAATQPIIQPTPDPVPPVG